MCTIPESRLPESISEGFFVGRDYRSRWSPDCLIQKECQCVSLVFVGFLRFSLVLSLFSVVLVRFSFFFHGSSLVFSLLRTFREYYLVSKCFLPAVGIPMALHSPPGRWQSSERR